MDWVKSGYESEAFWRLLSGPPPAGTTIQTAAACMRDDLYEHLPLRQPDCTPPSSPPSRVRRARVAVIGSGVAGAACAQALATRGKELVTVTVLEKAARSAGGKIQARGSKRGRDVDVSPCLFFSAVGQSFRKQVDKWVRGGVAEPFCSTGFLGVVAGNGRFLPFDCYPYSMANPWVLSAFEGFSAMGPGEGESISGGAYPDMTHGYIWNRMMGGTEDAARSLERAEEALAEAKVKGDMSGKDMAILARSVDNLRATARAAESGICQYLLASIYCKYLLTYCTNRLAPATAAAACGLVPSY